MSMHSSPSISPASHCGCGPSSKVTEPDKQPQPASQHCHDTGFRCIMAALAGWLGYCIMASLLEGAGQKRLSCALCYCQRVQCIPENPSPAGQVAKLPTFAPASPIMPIVPCPQFPNLGLHNWDPGFDENVATLKGTVVAGHLPWQLQAAKAWVTAWAEIALQCSQ